MFVLVIMCHALSSHPCCYNYMPEIFLWSWSTVPVSLILPEGNQGTTVDKFVAHILDFCLSCTPTAPFLHPPTQSLCTTHVDSAAETCDFFFFFPKYPLAESCCCLNI